MNHTFILNSKVKITTLAAKTKDQSQNLRIKLVELEGSLGLVSSLESRVDTLVDIVILIVSHSNFSYNSEPE